MRVAASLIAVAVSTIATRAHAVRPFVTDDARVVGKSTAQLESWVRWDETSTQHWFVPAYGPIAPLELTLGAVHGIAREPQPRHYSFAAPLLQAKFLFFEAKAGQPPGVALIAGTFLPFGTGGFRSPPSGFVYAAVTQSLFDDEVLLHANVGFAGAQIEDNEPDRPATERRNRFRATWGVASQIHLVSVVNLAAEIFSGDPYAEVSGGAAQGGFRFTLSNYVQVDATVGSGIWGEPRMPFWVSSGIRLVTDPL